MGHALAKFIPSVQKHLREFLRDSALLTVLRPGNIGCRQPDQQTGFQENFCQPSRLPGSAVPRYAASNPADAPFRFACSPAARSSQSTCARTRPVAPGRAPHRVRKSPHLQMSRRDKRSPGSGKTPGPAVTAVAPLPPTGADTVSVCPAFAPGTAINRDRASSEPALLVRMPDLPARSGMRGIPRQSAMRKAGNDGHAVPPFPQKAASSPGCALISILWFPGSAAGWSLCAGRAGPAFPDRTERSRSPALPGAATTGPRNVHST